MKLATLTTILLGLLVASACLGVAEAQGQRSEKERLSRGQRILVDKQFFDKKFAKGTGLISTDEGIIRGMRKIKGGSAVPTGHQPKIAEVERKYGKADKVVEEEVPAMTSGFSLGRPPPGVQTRKLTIHYYDNVGLGVEKANPGFVVWVTNSVESKKKE